MGKLADVNSWYICKGYLFLFYCQFQIAAQLIYLQGSDYGERALYLLIFFLHVPLKDPFHLLYLKFVLPYIFC